MMSSALEKIASAAISLILTAFFIKVSNQLRWGPYLGLDSVFLWFVVAILLGRTFEMSFVGAGIISLMFLLPIIGIFSLTLLLGILLWMLAGAMMVLIIAYALYGDEYGY